MWTDELYFNYARVAAINEDEGTFIFEADGIEAEETVETKTLSFEDNFRNYLTSLTLSFGDALKGVANAKGEVLDASTTAEYVKSEVDKAVDSSIRQRMEDMEAMRADMQDLIETLNTTIADLTDKIANLEASVKQSKSVADDAVAAVKNMKQHLDMLKTEAKSLEAIKKQLENQNTIALSEFAKLQQAYEEAQQKIDQLMNGESGRVVPSSETGDIIGEPTFN